VPDNMPEILGSHKQEASLCVEVEEEGNGDPHAVVSGMFNVNTLPTKVLFDAGATHSFVNPTTATRMACAFKELDVQLCVTTPIRSMYQSDLIARNCSIIIQGRLFFANLILLGIHGYDEILGMDWLTKYQAVIDYKQKILALVTLEGESLMYKGSYSKPTVPLISAAKACKLVGEGCTAYFYAVEVVGTPELELEDIPIVQEFLKIFQEVSSLSPDREIEFAIRTWYGPDLESTLQDGPSRIS